MFEILVRWFATFALAVALAATVVRMGPLTFRAPESIASNSPQRDDSRKILLLRRIEPLLPPGATLALFPRDPKLAEYDYLIALGQLPRQRVVSSRLLSAASAGPLAPRFIAAAAGEISDPRYRRTRTFPEGELFERIP